MAWVLIRLPTNVINAKIKVIFRFYGLQCDESMRFTHPNSSKTKKPNEKITVYSLVLLNRVLCRSTKIDVNAPVAKLSNHIVARTQPF